MIILLLFLLLCLISLNIAYYFLEKSMGGKHILTTYGGKHILNTYGDNKYLEYKLSLKLRVSEQLKDPLLFSIADILNTYKSKLDNIDFKKFKELDNILRITKELKIAYKDKRVSQAYFKMLEILEDFHIYHIFTNKKIRAFHVLCVGCVCVCAFHVYCNKYKLQYTWKAQTLKPNDTNTALGDNYGFIKNNLNNWLFGDDNNGDITSINNILSYEKESKFNFITSDCGIAFSRKNFNIQEQEIELINYSQFITMLLCLEKGGVSAMKIFLPFTRKISVFFTKLMVEHFEHVYLFKPSLNLTSSEVYIIGTNYRPIHSSTRTKILNIHNLLQNNQNIDNELTSYHLALFYKNYYHSFYKMILNTNNEIERYLYWLNNHNALNTLKSYKKKQIKYWNNKYL